MRVLTERAYFPIDSGRATRYALPRVDPEPFVSESDLPLTVASPSPAPASNAVVKGVRPAWLNAEGHERQCKGHNQRRVEQEDGTMIRVRCRRFAVRGTTVCRKHGAATPAVIAAVKRRLVEALDPAAARLFKLLKDPDSKVVLGAIKAIFDYAGLSPTQKLEVTTQQQSQFNEDDQKLLTEAEQVEVLVTLRNAKAHIDGIYAAARKRSAIIDVTPTK